MNPPMVTTTTGVATPVVAGMSADLLVDPVEKFVAPVAGAAERTLTIGKLVDSADDTARLLIITQYAGTDTVNVYESGDDVGPWTVNKDGTITLAVGADITETSVVATVKSVGVYYLSGAGTLDAASLGIVSDEAMPVEVFSYTVPGENAGDDDETTYVIEKSTTTAGATTRLYTIVDIHVLLDRDGDNDTGNDDGDENVLVTAKIPEATDYQHIHFGVWAALGAADKEGSQDVTDLGIGFVQNYSDSGPDRRRNAQLWQCHVQRQLGRNRAESRRRRQRGHQPEERGCIDVRGIREGHRQSYSDRFGHT